MHGLFSVSHKKLFYLGDHFIDHRFLTIVPEAKVLLSRVSVSLYIYKKKRIEVFLSCLFQGPTD